MEWTKDKVSHYKKSFNWSRTGLILGLVPILAFTIAGRFSLWLVLFLLSGFVLILLIGAAKELIYDKLLGQGQSEWNDMKANIIGAFDGLWRINKRF